MKKDITRDYATEAFRFYAACGRPTYEELKQRIYDDILAKEKREAIKATGKNKPPSNPVESANIKAEEEYERRSAELLDVLAVEKTMEILMRGCKNETIKCVEDVYFTEPQRPLKRGEIQERVQQAAQTLFLDERSIYRRLRDARQLFSSLRGLRTKSCQ